MTEQEIKARIAEWRAATFKASEMLRALEELGLVDSKGALSADVRELGYWRKLGVIARSGDPAKFEYKTRLRAARQGILPRSRGSHPYFFSWGFLDFLEENPGALEDRAAFDAMCRLGGAGEKRDRVNGPDLDYDTPETNKPDEPEDGWL